MKIFALYSILIVVTTTCGCTIVDFTAQDVSVPVIMNSKIQRPYTIVTHFVVEQEHKALFISRLVNAGRPDINVMIKKQLKATPGDAVINVHIHGETQEGDMLLPVIVGISGAFIFPYLSLFVLEPLIADLKSYTVEGDIINYTDDQEPNRPMKKLDPNTGLPIEEKKIEFDPETGLPIK